MMPKTVEGQLNAKGVRIAIAVARFNRFITEKLLDGALDAIRRTGGDLDQVTVSWVPGAWELPLVCQTLAKSQKFDAVIALGAVIQGDTPHFDYVAGQSASGLAGISLETDVPVIFGVLTTVTVEQAMDRAGIKAGNKGFDAAMTAIEMSNLLGQLKSS
jgi:6,7-dimethyl-8-ribityllumazine synthase